MSCMIWVIFGIYKWNSLMIYILSGFSKTIIMNVKIFNFIDKFKMKIPVKLNAKEEFEYNGESAYISVREHPHIKVKK